VKNDRPYLADILQALERVEEIGQRGRDAFLATGSSKTRPSATSRSWVRP
jgi:hypothetical protein